MRVCRSAAGFVFLSLFFYGSGAAGQITLDDILRANREAYEEIRSGRIRYTVERYESPSFLEMRGELERRGLEGLTAGEFEPHAKIMGLRGTGTYEVEFVFDRDADAARSRTVDTRDVDALIAELGLGEQGRDNLSKAVTRAVVRGNEVKYETGPNEVTVDYDGAYRLDAERTLEFGMIPTEVAAGAQVRVREESGDRDVVSVGVAEGERRYEFTLNKSLGFRVRALWTLNGDKLSYEERIDYRRWGEYVFPSVCVRRSYDAAGEVWESEKFTFSSVELNVPIEEEEFEVEIPRDASFFDRRTGEMRIGRGEETERAAREIVRGIGEEGREEAVELAAAPEVEGREARVIEEEAGEAPEERRGNRVWIYVTAAVVALVIGAALLDWRRKRRAEA